MLINNFGFLPFQIQGGYNYNSTFMPYGNFNFRLPLFTFNSFQTPYYMPMFTFPMYNPSNMATSFNNSELNPKQLSQMEEIQKLKYDSEALQDKLKETNNIKDYSKFLESNKDYSLADTIKVESGGNIYMYKDKDGKTVGSVRKDENGNIRNVTLNIADEGSISLNDNGSDGKIDSSFAMSKNYNVDIKDDDKTSYKDALAQMLKNYDGYSVEIKKLDNGNIVETYIHSGKTIVTSVKDKDEKIISLTQNNIKPDDKSIEQKYFYNDTNKNGIIDEGEGTTRFDRNL